MPIKFDDHRGVYRTMARTSVPYADAEDTALAPPYIWPREHIDKANFYLRRGLTLRDALRLAVLPEKERPV